MSKSIVGFIRAQFATLHNGVSIDYISICRRDGDKWPQVSRINHGPSLDAIESEAESKLDDIAQTAREERKKEQKIRLSVYRSSELVTTRTFTVAGVTDGSHEDDSPGGAGSEVVATMKELRLIVVDQNAALQRVAGRGWELALAQQAQLMEARNELHQARLELELHKAKSGMSPEAAAAIQGVFNNLPIFMQMAQEFLKKDDSENG